MHSLSTNTLSSHTSSFTQSLHAASESLSETTRAVVELVPRASTPAWCVRSNCTLQLFLFMLKFKTTFYFFEKTVFPVVQQNFHEKRLACACHVNIF